MQIAGKVKGTLLLTRLKYVRGMGPTTARRVLERLPPDDRELLEGALLLPSLWYPAEILQRLDVALANEVAAGDRERVLVDMGHFSADLNLGPRGVLRPYVRDDPHALLREIPRIQASLRGGSRREYQRLGDRAALVRAVREDAAGGDDCLSTLGWLQRAIELCGGRDVQVTETLCIDRGGRACEYCCEWR